MEAILLAFFFSFTPLSLPHTGHEHVVSQHREPFESSAVDLRRLSWTRDPNKLLSSHVQHCTGAVVLSCPRSHTSFIYISRWIFTPWFRGTRCRWCEHVLGMMCHRGGSWSGLPRGSFHQHQLHYSLFFQTKLSLLRVVGVLRIVWVYVMCYTNIYIFIFIVFNVVCINASKIKGAVSVQLP